MLRQANLVERLEGRTLYSTTVIHNGVEIGHLETYEPANGYKIAKTARSRGAASSAGAPGFQITIVFGGTLTATQQAVFATAAARWEAIIKGDLPDVTTDPAFGFVDDVTILASGEAIDGPGHILGSAGPTALRDTSSLPYAGEMQFDTADLATLESAGLLNTVIVHEMGHVLGIGTIWQRKNLLFGAGGANPIYDGSKATAEYQALSITTNDSVPVENAGGAGTRDSHWREIGPASFGNELMTGTINSAQANPLSRITAASLIDLGYTQVNLEGADLYTVPTNPTAAGSPAGDYTPRNPLPVITPLIASQTTIASGSTFTLSANSATDNSSTPITRFYRESNGVPGLQATGTDTFDTLVGISGDPSPLVSAFTAGLAGTYTYYARAADGYNAYSAVSSVTVSVVVPPTVPAAPTLVAALDTGVSNSDGITNLNVLTFFGAATANATVMLKNGATVIGTGTADSAGNYSITTSVLADGVYAVTATASNIAGTSLASAASTVRVDTVRPQNPSAAYDREVTQAITLAFGEAVSIPLSAAGIVLQNLTTGQTVSAYTVAIAGAGTAVTVQPTTLLTDGNYRLTIPAGNLTDLAGNSLASDFTFNFRQLGGDATGDGIVNFDDLVILSQNFNKTGLTASSGNFNLDAAGNVNFDDLVILAQNYNKNLNPMPLMAPAAMAASSAAASKSKTAPRSRAAADVIG